MWCGNLRLGHAEDARCKLPPAWAGALADGLCGPVRRVVSSPRSEIRKSFKLRVRCRWCMVLLRVELRDDTRAGACAVWRSASAGRAASRTGEPGVSPAAVTSAGLHTVTRRAAHRARNYYVEIVKFSSCTGLTTRASGFTLFLPRRRRLTVNGVPSVRDSGTKIRPSGLHALNGSFY